MLLLLPLNASAGYNTYFLFSNLFPLSPFIRPQQTLLMNKKRALSERFFFQKVPSTIHIVGVVLLTTNHHSSWWFMFEYKFVVKLLSKRIFVVKLWRFLTFLVQLRSCRNLIIQNQNIESFSSFYKVCSGDNHTARINSHHLTWRKICDCK